MLFFLNFNREAEGKLISESEQLYRSKKGDGNVSTFQTAAQPHMFKDREAEGKFIYESEQRKRSKKGDINVSSFQAAAQPDMFTDRTGRLRESSSKSPSSTRGA